MGPPLRSTGPGSRPARGRDSCTGSAPPAVPLVRLSIAPTATSRPARSSTVTCRWTAFDPTVALVVGHEPSGKQVHERLLLVRTPRRHRGRLPSVTPGLIGADAVARMPRDIGARTGVKLTLTGSSVRVARFCVDLRSVPMHPDAVRRRRAHHLRAHQVRFGALACSGRAGDRHDDDPGGVDESGLRRQAQGPGSRLWGSSPGPRSCGRRSAASRWPGQLGQPVRPRACPLAAVEVRPVLHRTSAGSRRRSRSPPSMSAAPRRSRPRPRAAARGRPRHDRPGSSAFVGFDHTIGQRNEVRLMAGRAPCQHWSPRSAHRSRPQDATAAAAAALLRRTRSHPRRRPEMSCA